MIAFLQQLRSTTMRENASLTLERPCRTAWNKGKLVGPKPPLRPMQVWAIRTRPMLERQTRDLAMFNIARNVDVGEKTMSQVLDFATADFRNSERVFSHTSR